MDIRKTTLISLLILLAVSSDAQIIPIEVVMSNKDYRYQHFFSTKLSPSSKFGIFHTSSLYFPFEKSRETELMYQSYLTGKLTRSITLLAGTFYASVPGFKASGGIQYKYYQNNLLVLIAPRIDLWKDPSYELLTLAECKLPISAQLFFYARLQMLSNYSGAVHNRSYQNLRIGIGNHPIQAGFAMNLDQYGSEAMRVNSFGIFLRHQLKHL